ncbi:MAG: NAD(P)H-dependent glycerol-3-phosphate dehydrogenase [Parachlamydiales bacterium]|jgi:glycerol-3-phosphate dehydrogenase (NAD(P)+)
MQIAYLGAGTWGTALANLLASNGHTVKAWDRNQQMVRLLNRTRKHPKLNFELHPQIHYVETLEEAIRGADLIVESVTSSGIRPVFEEIKRLFGPALPPIVITSKGIEQGTGLLFYDVLLEILGEEKKNSIGCLSGPSHAEEVIKNLPTSVVCSAYDPELIKLIQTAFNSPHVRVYPNSDLKGILFGGSMKNVIAIACAISDGFGFGDNTRAALMTRGLHEMRKLALAIGCRNETLFGLSGLGDLFVTCSSTLSRNYRFGRLIARGYSLEKAKAEIGMAVEGAYSCVSAYELGKRWDIPLPITEATYRILYEGLSPEAAVKALFTREIKEERL